MTQTLNDALVAIWFDAWSRSRGYETRAEGAARSALRVPRSAQRIPGGSGRATVDIPAAWEHVLLEPTAEDLDPVLRELDEHPEQMVTVFGEAQADLAELGLSPLVEGERIMVIDIDPETIDVEAPILPDGYSASVDSPGDPDSRRLRIFADEASTAPEGESELAAMGRATFQDGVAVFDRIWTSPQHRRRGLGALVMRHLTSEVVNDGEISEGLLVASPDGQLLYGHLGWTDLGPVSIWTKSREQSRPSPEHTGTVAP